MSATNKFPFTLEGQSVVSHAILEVIYRACQCGDSPERMHAAVMALLPDAAQAPSAPVAPINERKAFEKEMNARRFFPAELDFSMTKSPSGKRDEYVNTHLESCWNGWQARAALSVQAGPVASAPICRNQGGICACRSGGSFGGCALERAAPTPPTTGEA